MKKITHQQIDTTIIQLHNKHMRSASAIQLLRLEERPSPLSEYCSKEIGSRVVQAFLKC